MLNVVCVKWGDKYGPEYVNILHDMVRRNLTEGYEGKFICFTDDATGLNPGIEVRGLPPDVDGWWNKLALFKVFFREDDRVLYLDLDTVITGPLDALANYEGTFAICRDFYRPDGLQSCVMAWNGSFPGIWDEWCAAGKPRLGGGDQAWIEFYMRRHEFAPDILQDLFPGLLVSFKADCHPYPPEGAAVVNFHGEPKPDNCAEEWVAMTWKIGGGSAKELREVCNTNVEQVLANIRANSLRELPWLEPVARHEDHCVIVGGGPSLWGTLDSLRVRYGLGQAIFATNNTHDLLVKEHVIPHAHVLVDARPENIDFVRNPRGAAYYLASQCDPALFDSLTAEEVVLFHCNTERIIEAIPQLGKPEHLVGGGGTVVLRTMALAYALGFRKLHLYGVDSCYTGETIHHAYPQPLNDGERVLDAVFNGKKYRCAAWMIGQAEQFQALAQDLAELGCIITVQGSGLIPDIARDLMANPPMRAADLRANAILQRLGDGPKQGAEIGVFAAELSSRLLLSKPDLMLIAVDAWEGGGASYADGAGDFHAKLTAFQQQAYYERALESLAFAKDRVRVMRARSTDAVRDVRPWSLDFVFIDADHSYEGAARDIAAWRSRVKDGGLMCGHDYAHPEFPGVQRAVDEFVAKEGKPLECGENFTWFVRV